MTRMFPAMQEWVRLQELGARVSRNQLEDTMVTIAALRRMAGDAEALARIAQNRADLLIDRVAEHCRHHHLKSRSRGKREE